MKIGGYASSAPSTPARTTARAGEAFTMSEGRGSAGRVALAAPPVGMFAVAPLGDALDKRRRLIARGRAMLDALDDLKAAHLAGASGEEALLRLARESSEAGEPVDDALDDILGHVRLRAAVELAKAGRG